MWSPRLLLRPRPATLLRPQAEVDWPTASAAPEVLLLLRPALRLTHVPLRHLLPVLLRPRRRARRLPRELSVVPLHDLGEQQELRPRLLPCGDLRGRARNRRGLSLRMPELVACGVRWRCALRCRVAPRSRGLAPDKPVSWSAMVLRLRGAHGEARRSRRLRRLGGRPGL